MSNSSQNWWIDCISAVPCFKRLFPHRGMNVCLICEASLSQHTLYMGNLVPMYTMFYVFPCWPKKKPDVRTPPPPQTASPHHRTDIEADR